MDHIISNRIQFFHLKTPLYCGVLRGVHCKTILKILVEVFTILIWLEYINTFSNLFFNFMSELFEHFKWFRFSSNTHDHIWYGHEWWNMYIHLWHELLLIHIQFIRSFTLLVKSVLVSLLINKLYKFHTIIIKRIIYLSLCNLMIIVSLIWPSLWCYK
jgi:hypothetical protein